jgi:hypothetical protein
VKTVVTETFCHSGTRASADPESPASNTVEIPGLRLRRIRNDNPKEKRAA